MRRDPERQLQAPTELTHPVAQAAPRVVRRRLGGTFHWRGENIATTEVEAALSEHRDVEQAIVHEVALPGTDGKAGMADVSPGKTGLVVR